MTMPATKVPVQSFGISTKTCLSTRSRAALRSWKRRW
jgi:hypothetical protein